MVTMFTNCKTTNWLTKGISSKKLAKEKAKVIAKAKKQIEKMPSEVCGLAVKDSNNIGCEASRDES